MQTGAERQSQPERNDFLHGPCKPSHIPHIVHWSQDMKVLSWQKMLMLVAAVAALISTVASQIAKVPENSLLTQIRREFQRVSPGISEVSILEVVPYRFLEAPARKYVLIAYGTKNPEPTFKGNFWDEVFGFFVADGKLTGIESTFDIVPSPRWRDYRFKIGSISDDSVTIRGAGDTYGDGPKELKFKWDPFKAHTGQKQ